MIYIQGLLLVLLLGFVSAGPKCPEGKELIKLVKGQDVFDLEFGITDKNAYKALKGKMGVLVRNGDVLSIDADFQFFTAKKLCVTTKKATEVEFRFFGEGLEHISSKTITTSKDSSIICAPVPSSELLAIWIFFRNRDESGMFNIKVKDLFMKACME